MNVERSTTKGRPCSQFLSRLRGTGSIAPILAATLFSNLVHATTYYVATDGKDSAVGTQSAPWRTIAHAVSEMDAGDTTYVKGGVYNEGLIRFRRSGTASAPIRLLAAPGVSPEIDFGVTGSGRDFRMILIQNSAGERFEIGHISIEGFEIRRGLNGIKMYSAHDITIRRNWIHDNQSQGILGDGKNVLVDRNTINQNGNLLTCKSCNKDHGIYASGTKWVIINNLIYGNQAYGIQIAGYPWCTDGQCYGGGSKYKADASYSGASDWLIANNTIAYQNYRGGIVLWMADTKNIKIINNIFYENSQKLNNRDVHGVDFLGAGSGHVIQNNIFHASGSGGTGMFGSSAREGVHYSQSANVNRSPQFVGADATMPGKPNFALAATSPAINMGQSLPATRVSFNNVSRPNGAYDVGAYEYGSGSSLQVPTAPSGFDVQ